MAAWRSLNQPGSQEPLATTLAHAERAGIDPTAARCARSGASKVIRAARARVPGRDPDVAGGKAPRRPENRESSGIDNISDLTTFDHIPGLLTSRADFDEPRAGHDPRAAAAASQWRARADPARSGLRATADREAENGEGSNRYSLSMQRLHLRTPTKARRGKSRNLQPPCSRTGL